jgi:hypothetical protein
MDGVPTQTAGTSEILASDWNTYVRDNFDSIKFGHVTVADDSAKSALSVAEGTMVYQLDNQKVFVYSGSAWVEVSDLDSTDGVPTSAQTKLDTVGMVHITTVAFSTSSAINVNDCFSATYDNYRVMLHTTSASVSGSILRMRMRASGTDSSVNYYFSGIQTSSQSATISSWRGNNVTYWEYGYAFADRTSLTLDIFRPFDAVATLFHSSATGDDNVANLTTHYLAGHHLVGTSYDGFSIFPSSGNLTGTLRVYGYRDA